MAAFSVKEFCNNPSVDKLTNKVIRKDEWIGIAVYFEIGVSSTMKKEMLRNKVVEELVQQGILEEGAVSSILGYIQEGSSPRESDVESEDKSSFRDEKDTAGWSAERFAFEREKLELEKERLASVERIRIKELEIEERRRSEDSLQDRSFSLRKNVNLVPPFNEKDPDGYFRTFERTAKHLNWPKPEWTWLLQTKLVGRAAVTYTNLDKTEDYDFVKKSILDSYCITPDGYRQKFRNYIKPPIDTFVEFFTEKHRLFKKWLEATETSTFEQLVNIVVLEEAKQKLPLNILLHVEEKGEKDLMKTARIADSYFLLLKSHSAKNRENPIVKSPGSVNPGISIGVKNPNNYKYCSYCKQAGHSIDNCTDPRCKKSANPSTALGKSDSSRDTWKNNSSYTRDKFKTPQNSKPIHNANVCASDSKDYFEGFKFKGVVSVDNPSKYHKVIILRDTGAAQSIICKSCLPGIENHYTGEKVVLNDLTSTTTLMLAKIYLDCPLIKGYVIVGVREEELPVKGVGLLLGNDLVGKVVMPSLMVVDSPLVESPTKDLDVCQPHIFPACAVTRAQSNLSQSNTNSDSSIDKLPSPLLTRDNLIAEQAADVTLAYCRNTAVENKSSICKVPCFYYSEGILMRLFRPVDLPSADTWSEVHQIVVPRSIRISLVELAHDGLAGHLGIKKTSQKLLQHYFWPGLKKDVQSFVRSCHICQMVGKPNDRIPPAPLKPIPVLREPFERIIIDCVGPLPRTKKGNQYLLTVMCPTTRYPDAFPLKNIRAKTITRCLLQMFTSVGIPKEIQSDRGSNFTSGLFQQVLKELNITQSLSSAYHPQSQGCLERFHQTFKSMLKKYCLEYSSDWDENVCLLLFALRECPQESLGYSPFQLLYGRQVRGPLKVLKDHWFSDPCPSPHLTVAQYVDNLKCNLLKVRKLALANLEKSQYKMKVHYDNKAKIRSFVPGDKVLLFLPIPGNPLKSKYNGPYVVLQKLSDHNYVVQTPDRRKDSQLVHVNLMKSFVERSLPDDSLNCSNVMCNTSINYSNSDDFEVTDIPSPKTNPCNSEILKDLGKHLDYLSKPMKDELKNLIELYPNLTSDFPGRCNVLLHDVELFPDCKSPVRQAAYRVNPAKKEIMKKEVDFLLANNLAEPSKSPWASPCLLVPKSDTSWRFCTDFRKINRMTIPDSFPLPLIEDLIDAIGESKFVTTLDLQKGYYQIGLTQRAKEISAFVTPFGLYQYLVMPFGMRNAPATFQRVINYTIQDLEGTYAYLDDILVISDDWETHIRRLTKLFARLSEVSLTINLAKSVFGRAQVNYLGHVVGGGHTRPKQANVESILTFPTPSSRKSLLRFLGMVGYYRRFCSNFSTIAAPLTNITSSKVPFKWDSLCESAFQRLKQFLISDPVLKTPDHNRPFVLQIDASTIGVGAALLQAESQTGVLHPVSFYSAKLKAAQRRYSTIELEALSLVMALKKFEAYLYQHPHPIEVFTDHNPLVFIDKMQHQNQRILRWAIQIQQFNLVIKHIKGTENVLADPLSRDLV